MNRIALVNPRGQLEIATPNGRQRVQLTNNNERAFHFPTWSPDGRLLAAIAANQSEASVVVFEGGEQDFDPEVGADFHVLYNSREQPPFYLYWSPNGRYITFLASHPRGGIGLHLAPVFGGGSRLLGTGRPLFWSWQKDSQSIFVHVGDSSNDVSSRLAFIDHPFSFEGSNVALPGHFQTPGISPSGRFWAYATRDSSEHGQVVIESAATHETFAVKHEGAAVMTWSPQRDQLAFISPANPARHFYGMLRLMDAVSHRAEVLVDQVVLAFFWSPNGRRIAYFTIANERGLARTLGEVTIKAGYAMGRTLPPLRPNELWLNLWVVDVVTGERRLLTPFKPHPDYLNRFLPYFDQFALSHQVWSPDSRQILLPAITADVEMVVAMPVDGLPPFLVAEGIVGFWSHQ